MMALRVTKSGVASNGYGGDKAEHNGGPRSQECCRNYQEKRKIRQTT